MVSSTLRGVASGTAILRGVAFVGTTLGGLAGSGGGGGGLGLRLLDRFGGCLDRFGEELSDALSLLAHGSEGIPAGCFECST